MMMMMSVSFLSHALPVDCCTYCDHRLVGHVDIGR